MNKTAIEEVIEKFEHALSYNVEGGLVEPYSWTEFSNYLHELLEKEKQRVIGDYTKMNRTAMQELIEEFEKSPLMFAAALSMIEQLNSIEKEKEQIIDAAEIIPFHTSGEEYYNEKYKI